jgi:hypothetical protein
MHLIEIKHLIENTKQLIILKQKLLYKNCINNMTKLICDF